MRPRLARAICLLLWVTATAFAQAEPRAEDPFAPYLDGKAPAIVRELPVAVTPSGVALKRVLFASRDDTEIYAVIATPLAPGPHPGMLVLHGGGGSAEIEKAISWAQRGYVAVAPDLPGIAEPHKLTEPKGAWTKMKYGEGRWIATPDVKASVLFDAVLAAMKSLYLLEAQPEVDKSKIGVVGISWGGYMTTMVCGLAGAQVRAGFAIFGCGFYEFTSQEKTTMAKMSDAEKATWLRDLDAGRRAPGIQADFFLVGATNDFFFWPRAVQATLDAIPGHKNHLYSPNSNHQALPPGGTVFPPTHAEPFKPTAFQSFPTPSGNKANWLAMEVPYFDFLLKGEGEPFPKVTLIPSPDPLVPRFSITAPRKLTQVQVWWSVPNDDWMGRKWLAIPARTKGDGLYEASIPPDFAGDGTDWFVVASDDRPVSVSSDLVRVAPEP